MEKITTFLMFKDRAHEAMKFYCSVFKGSKILGTMKQGSKVVGGTFKLMGQTFMCHEGGPHFAFSEGISLFVRCKDQKEVDYYCGWLRDRFGVSWQIIPDALMECISDKDAAKASPAIDAMLKMRKIDIAAIKRAHGGK
jgi:predicted 3-demethylubiquinone-9 3-methyltransferase (glyoxalase superfamily)